MSKKFNLIDVLVLIVVIVFAVGLYMRFSAPQSKKVTVNTSYEVTVKVSDIRSFTRDALKKSTTIFAEDSGVALGEITGVEEAPFAKALETLEGDFVSAEVPEKYECLVTFKTDLRETDTGYYAADSSEIKVGSTFYIYSKYVATSCTIVSIEKQS